MKVIFTQTVPDMAQRGETKEVKSGYARNFLFPRRVAILPTDPRARALRAQYRTQALTLANQKRLLAELSAGWRGQTFKVKAKASADGTLYGSIGLKEIRKLLGRDDLEFTMPTLKNVGTHAIELTFTDGTTIPITVVIQSETTK